MISSKRRGSPGASRARASAASSPARTRRAAARRLLVCLADVRRTRDSVGPPAVLIRKSERTRQHARAPAPARRSRPSRGRRGAPGVPRAARPRRPPSPAPTAVAQGPRACPCRGQRARGPRARAASNGSTQRHAHGPCPRPAISRSGSLSAGARRASPCPAAAHAHRLEADRLVARLEVVQQRAHDPRARHPVG